MRLHASSGGHLVHARDLFSGRHRSISLQPQEQRAQLLLHRPRLQLCASWGAAGCTTGNRLAEGGICHDTVRLSSCFVLLRCGRVLGRCKAAGPRSGRGSCHRRVRHIAVRLRSRDLLLQLGAVLVLGSLSPLIHHLESYSAGGWVPQSSDADGSHIHWTDATADGVALSSLQFHRGALWLADEAARAHDGVRDASLPHPLFALQLIVHHAPAQGVEHDADRVAFVPICHEQRGDEKHALYTRPGCRLHRCLDTIVVHLPSRAKAPALKRQDDTAINALERLLHRLGIRCVTLQELQSASHGSVQHLRVLLEACPFVTVVHCSDATVWRLLNEAPHYKGTRRAQAPDHQIRRHRPGQCECG
mmetsp:Transcript_20903/g.62915  ORF Transcript_20903/g.62915 Transcript_20903/m.62915 type:complete len:361 (-) Transcript_20903:181-1263(-)